MEGKSRQKIGEKHFVRFDFVEVSLGSKSQFSVLCNGGK